MAGKIRKRHVQLTLDDARKEVGQGGWRRHAGRKKKPGSISHDKRPRFAAHHPQHVTIRLVESAPSLARDWLMTIIRKAIADSHKPGFRIIEFNVLCNHLHLVIEAANEHALSAGMQGFEVRLARRVNRALGRRGQLFAHRYHARSMTTPRDVRNTLRYVLLNRKHHAAEKKFSKYWIDPYSSAAWFKGWAAPIRCDTYWKQHLVAMAAPTKPPSVWLLTTGWLKHYGPLRFDEAPA